MIYSNIESVYSAIIKKIESQLREKYETESSKNPDFLLEFLKEEKLIHFGGLDQKFIYSFAQLSLQGHMPLMENECYWEDKFANFNDEKPVFAKKKSQVPECYHEMYNKNPFCWGSDLSDYDGAFDVLFSLERSTHDKKAHPGSFDITVIVDKDHEGHRLHRESHSLYHNKGRACFVFRVDIKNNSKKINLILGKFKTWLINRKVQKILGESFDKLTEEIGEQIFKKLSL